MLERRLWAVRLTIGGAMEANSTPVVNQPAEQERLDYSVQEAADFRS
jgi:hypothetical protein